MLIRATIKGSVDSVVAENTHDKGSDKINLQLKKVENGTRIYEGAWIAHDTTGQIPYRTIIRVTSPVGKIASAQVEWLDPTVSHKPEEIVAGNFTGSWYNFNSTSPVLFINSTSGKVGIGTTSPSAELDVNGDILADNILIKVSEVNVSSNCNYVEFTNLDGNSAWFYKLLFVVKNAGASTCKYALYVNGDTTDTNYYSQRFEAYGTSTVIERYNNNYFCQGIASGERAMATATITKDPDGYFRWTSQAGQASGSSIHIQLWAGVKNATITNITSIRVAASVPNGIGAGSKLILYKARR